MERRENLFWVNPHMFYKGDRIRIVREYVRAGTDAAKAIEAEQSLLQQQQIPFDEPSE